MSYIDGFLVPVTTDNKVACRATVIAAAALFKEFGATRAVECWAMACPTEKSPTSIAR